MGYCAEVLINPVLMRQQQQGFAAAKRAKPRARPTTAAARQEAVEAGLQMIEETWPLGRNEVTRRAHQRDAEQARRQWTALRRALDSRKLPSRSAAP